MADSTRPAGTGLADTDSTHAGQPSTGPVGARPSSAQTSGAQTTGAQTTVTAAGPAAGGAAISYGETFERAARFARVLAEAGAGPGERVMVCVDKSVDAVAAYLACLHSGAVHVPLNPAFTDDELAYFLADAEPSVAVVDPWRADAVRRLCRSAGRSGAEMEAERGHRLHTEVLTLAGDGTGSLVDQAAVATPLPIAERHGTDLAALLYTSGTTGKPKGAALTHAGLRLNSRALHSAWRFGPDDRLIHSLPLFHVHGLFVALHCAMESAIPVAFLPRFDPGAVVAEMHDATVFMGVPTHYRRLLDTPGFDKRACAGMRLFTSGSAPLPKPLFAEFAERSGHVICERYGMSETMILTSNPYAGARLPGTVGFALDGVELRVSSAEGRVCRPGETGVIEVRSEQTMSGYWRRPEATAAARSADGWFVTGDLGALDAEGRLSIRGRVSEMIISGGENVYPAEVEAVLDSVAGVRESAVIGTADDDLGEAVTAVVVADKTVLAGAGGATGNSEPAAGYRATEQAMRAALDARLARFKHPRRIVWADELPRNAMGKLQKDLLRERFGFS